MTQATTASAPLTPENLKALSLSSTSRYTSTPSCVSEDDAASLFSACESALSSTSSAPEDEEVPYTVQSSTGEGITVYQSLEQAVRYSLLRSENERRSEDEARRFAYAPLTVGSSSLTPASTSWDAALEVGHGVGEIEEDEDAYFSMG